MNDPASQVEGAISESATPSKDAIVAAAKDLERACREKAAQHGPALPDTAFTWIVPYAETYCSPDPNDPKQAVTELAAVRKNFESGQVTAVSGLASKIEDWEGKAADSFYDHFLAPFPQAVTNQIGITEELSVALRCYESMLRSGRADTLQILKKATQVVEAFDGDKGASASVGLTIVAAVTTILTGAPASALGVTMGLNLATGTRAAATVGTAMIAANQTISGDTVSEIMDSMRTSWTDVRKEMDNKERLLGEALAKTHDEVNQILNSGSQTTLQKLLPNEGTGSGGRTTNEGGLEGRPSDGPPDSGNDSQPDILDGEHNDTPEFRPPS